jgi:hypothetical protein
MSGRTRLNLLLVAAMMALAFATYLDLRQIDSAAPPLTQLDPSLIRHIRISDHRGRDIRLERQGDHWYMIHPYAVHADDDRIETLMGITSTPVHRRFSAAQHRLDSFGLAPVRLRLWLNNLEFAFGATDPIHFRRYVSQNGSIMLIDDGFQHHLTAPPESFVDPVPLPLRASVVRAQFDGNPLGPETAARWGATAAETVESQPWDGAGVRLWVELAQEQEILEFRILEQGRRWLRPDLGLAYRFGNPLDPPPTIAVPLTQ